jgi:hypothetical protein
VSADWDTTGPIWFDSTKVVELTQDGRPDTLRVRAFGVRSDKLSILFSITTDRQTLHRTPWGSSYELIDTSLPSDASPEERDYYVRERLAMVIASMRVAALDSGVIAPLWDYLPAEVVHDLLRRHPPTLTFFYGYESHEVLVWSQCSGTFIVLPGGN